MDINNPPHMLAFCFAASVAILAVIYGVAYAIRLGHRIANKIRLGPAPHTYLIAIRDDGSKETATLRGDAVTLREIKREAARNFRMWKEIVAIEAVDGRHHGLRIERPA